MTVSCWKRVWQCYPRSGTVPLPAQEQSLVEDLLSVLVGVDGRDITAQPVLGRQNRSFIVDPTLDISVKELVNRILPVASYYSTITRWVVKTSSWINPFKIVKMVCSHDGPSVTVIVSQVHRGEVILWVWPGEPRAVVGHEDSNEGIHDPGRPVGAPPEARHTDHAEALVLQPANHEVHGDPRLYWWESNAFLVRQWRKWVWCWLMCDFPLYCS